MIEQDSKNMEHSTTVHFTTTVHTTTTVRSTTTIHSTTIDHYTTSQTRHMDSPHNTIQVHVSTDALPTAQKIKEWTNTTGVSWFGQDLGVAKAIRDQYIRRLSKPRKVPLQLWKPKTWPKKPKEAYRGLWELTFAAYRGLPPRELRDYIYSHIMPDRDEGHRAWLYDYINIREVLRSPPPFLDSSKVFQPFLYEAVEMLYGIGLHGLPRGMSWDTYIRTPLFQDGPTPLFSQIPIRAAMIDVDSIIPFFEAISQVETVPDLDLFIHIPNRWKSATGLKSWATYPGYPAALPIMSPWPPETADIGTGYFVKEPISWNGPLSHITSESSDGDILRKIGGDWTANLLGFPTWYLL